MRRLTIVLTVVFAACVPVAAAAATPRRVTSRSYTYRVTIKTILVEFEDAQNQPLPGPDDTPCPPARKLPSVKERCTAWASRRLGHGIYTQTDAVFEVGNITWKFTFTDSHGDTLTGTGHSPGVNPDPTPPHTVGHVNRFPGEVYTVTGGTGRYAGATGELVGSAQTVVLSVDAATGVAHKQGTDTVTGKLTFPKKL